MADQTLRIDGQLAALIEEVRNARETVARRRAAQLIVRYPEVNAEQVNPLDDREVIMASLTRELRHQHTVLRDINRELE